MLSTGLLTLASFPLTRHSILLRSDTGQWICQEGEQKIFYSYNVIYITGIYEISGIQLQKGYPPMLKLVLLGLP